MSSAVTTTMSQSQISDDEPLGKVTWKQRYSSSRLCINDDDMSPSWGRVPTWIFAKTFGVRNYSSKYHLAFNAWQWARLSIQYQHVMERRTEGPRGPRYIPCYAYIHCVVKMAVKAVFVSVQWACGCEHEIHWLSDPSCIIICWMKEVGCDSFNSSHLSTILADIEDCYIYHHTHKHTGTPHYKHPPATIPRARDGGNMQNFYNKAILASVVERSTAISGMEMRLFPNKIQSVRVACQWFIRIWYWKYWKLLYCAQKKKPFILQYILNTLKLIQTKLIKLIDLKL